MAKVEAIEFAKKIGTYDSPDRSKQYPLNDVDDIKDAVHKCWVKIHLLEAAKTELEAEIHRKDVLVGDLKDKIEDYRDKLRNSRTANMILTLALFGLWELVKAVFFK